MWSANATNNFFILQNLTTCFGPYGPSSGDNYHNDKDKAKLPYEVETQNPYSTNLQKGESVSDIISIGHAVSDG
jgi:hypothetical protein